MIKFDDTNIKMHSLNNEGKFLIAERYIKSLKSWLCKCMSLIG